MAWPETLDYNAAIQNLRSSFSDPELRQGEPTLNAMGLPMPRSGNFADVYEIRCPATGRSWAVKCFKREVAGLQNRYHEIATHLKQVRLPFMVDFDYLQQGTRVRGAWYPILKMAWVEGFSLNQFVEDSAQKPGILQAILRLWALLAQRLRDAQIAHGDLQHGNVILTPVAGGQLALRLIDYDGMFVPSLAAQRAGEAGHPNFQHPQRIRDGSYTIDGDRFSHLVIYCAIRSLVTGGRALWNRYDNGDNLLFREQDFLSPAISPLFHELWKTPDAEVQNLCGHLILACVKPLQEVPWLDAVVTETGIRPLTPQQWTQVNTMLQRGASHVRPLVRFTPGTPVVRSAATVGTAPQQWPWGAGQRPDMIAQPVIPLSRSPSRREIAQLVRRGVLWAAGVWALIMLIVFGVQYGPSLMARLSGEEPPSSRQGAPVGSPLSNLPVAAPSPPPQDVRPPEPATPVATGVASPPVTNTASPVTNSAPAGLEPKVADVQPQAPMTPAGQTPSGTANNPETPTNAPPQAPATPEQPVSIRSAIDQATEEKWAHWAETKAYQIGGHFLARVPLRSGETTISLANYRGNASPELLSSTDAVTRGFSLGSGRLYFGAEVYSFGNKEFDSQEPVRMLEIPELAERLHLLSVRVELRTDEMDARVAVVGDADLATVEERREKITRLWSKIAGSLDPSRLNDRFFRELGDLLNWNATTLGEDRKALRDAFKSPVTNELKRLDRILKSAKRTSQPAEVLGVDKRDEALRQLQEGSREISLILYKRPSN